MKIFLKNIVLFFFLTIIVGEIVIRMTHSVSDVPQRTIDQYGIQKYFPDQEGYWKGGKHKWVINKLGWAGELPDNFDNLISIIGDSYIENFMNPNECHQSIFLKENLRAFNFMEAGRSGVSLIEAMEISKQIDSLKPLQTLIYVNNNDFFESVFEIKPLDDITQLRLKDHNINYGQLKAAGLKKILYNWKLLYYFYNRFPILNSSVNNKELNKNKSTNKNGIKYKKEIFKLIDYISVKYSIKNKTLVFHPNSHKLIINKCRDVGFNVISLDSRNDKGWTFDHDSHWTCYGHKKVAQQVYESILMTNLLKPKTNLTNKK
tara:strand:+ start:7814 stop:8767 length:954 start_codon:yes stop_codon:yes gene_type:complete